MMRGVWLQHINDLMFGVIITLIERFMSSEIQYSHSLPDLLPSSLFSFLCVCGTSMNRVHHMALNSFYKNDDILFFFNKW